MLESLARVLVYIPALFFLGAIGYRLRYGVSDPLHRLALAAAIGLAAASILRLAAHTYAAFGEDAFALESFRTVAIESRWGTRWRWQLVSSASAVLAVRLARRKPRLGWGLATLAGLGLCGSLPLTGHAMALGPVAVALQSAHVAGAGLWIGTLFVLAALGGKGFREFAPLAMTGAFLLVAGGTGTAWLSFPDATTISSSPYGRLFLLKLVLVAGVAGFGFRNWRHFRSNGEGGGFVGREIALAALVLVVTGWLSETGTP
jgi:putative copper export protein